MPDKATRCCSWLGVVLSVIKTYSAGGLKGDPNRSGEMAFRRRKCADNNVQFARFSWLFCQYLYAFLLLLRFGIRFWVGVFSHSRRDRNRFNMFLIPKKGGGGGLERDPFFGWGGWGVVGGPLKVFFVCQSL